LSSQSARNQRKRRPLSHFQEHASVKTRRPGIRQSSWCKNKKSAEPRPLREPPRRGRREQHMVDAPYGARPQVAASLHFQERLGSGSRFSLKQFLTLTRHLNCHGSVSATFVCRIVLLLIWEIC
jgi:hypothetical protein